MFLSGRVIEPKMKTAHSTIISKFTSKRDTFYVKWQPGTSKDEKKKSKNPKCAY